MTVDDILDFKFDFGYWNAIDFIYKDEYSIMIYIKSGEFTVFNSEADVIKNGTMKIYDCK